MARLRMTKTSWLALAGGIFLGMVVMIGVRMSTLKNEDTHYHANFALYINGVRDPFKSFTFYEEVQSCDAEGSKDPRTRVHLHDNIGDTVHVHDTRVTWSALFSNLGYSLGNKLVATDSGVFVDGQDGKHLSFVLNGNAVDTVANRVIGDKDALLISYGTEDKAGLQKQYSSIAHTAAKNDAENDPSTCSGTEPLTFMQRFKKATIGN